MNALVFNYKCGGCGHVFAAPEVPDFSYGEFVMRSENERLPAHLDTLEDGVFEEVGAIARRISTSNDTSKFVDLCQRAFEFACDPAPDGSRYQIGLAPKCPICGGTKPMWREAHIPPQKVVIPCVSHNKWAGYSEIEKHAIIRSILRQPPTNTITP